MRCLTAAIALLALSACAETAAMGQGTDPGPPMVRILSGSAATGRTEIVVRADDTIVTTVTGPAGARTETVASWLGLHNNLRAGIIAEGPAIAAGIDPDLRPCEGYGTDLVEIAPPDDGFARVASTCPDPAMQAFQRRLVALLAPPMPG